jgi:hypothetical protein
MGVDEVGQMEDQRIGFLEGEIAEASALRRPVDAGTYTLIRVEDDADRDFKSGTYTYKGTQWYAFMTFKVSGGPFDGAIVSGGINTMKKLDANATTAHDYLKANGSTARPTSEKEWETEVRKHFGPLKAIVDWEWKTKHGEETVELLKGQKNTKSPKKYAKAGLPKVTVAKDSQGKTNHVQVDPTTGQEVGARAVVTLFLPKAGTASNGSGKTVTVPKVTATEG